MTLDEKPSPPSSTWRANVKVLLDGIAIKNYRSFEEFPKPFPKEGLPEYLELGRLTTIIGKNDVGKSNLLHAIMLILNEEKANLMDFHKGNTSNDVLINARFVIIGDLIDIEKFKKELGKYNIYVDSSNHFHLQLCIHYNPAGNKTSESWYTYSITRTLDKIDVERYRVRRSTINNLIENVLPKPLYIPSFTVPSNEVSLKRGSLLSELIVPLIEEETSRINDRSEINVKEFLKEKVEERINIISEKLAENLRNVWSDIEDVRITVSRIKLSQALDIDVKIIDKYIGEISLPMRGSGLQREFIVELLKVYRDLKIRGNHILLIEEPEIFLHAGAQRKFMSILRDISRNGQVIITTHSSVFIDRSNLRYVYLLKKEGGHTVLAWASSKDARLSEVVEELGISPSDVLLANGIIIVEGIIDAEILSLFARKVIPYWDELNIAVICGGGMGNIKHYLNLIDSLKMINHNIALILDADIKSQNQNKLPPKKEAFKKRMEEQGIPVYFWKKDNVYVREIENLFDAESINKLLKEIIENAMNKRCINYMIRPEELAPHVDVIELCKEKLEKCGLGKIAEDIHKNKRKFCKKVAKIMVEDNKVPEDLKNLLEEIIKKFISSITQ